MADISARQINLERPDPLRTFNDLNAFMDRRIVRPCPYLGGSVVTVAGTFVKISSSHIPGVIAPLPAPLPSSHSGVCAVKVLKYGLQFYDTIFADDLGNILNLVEVRDNDTKEAITDGGMIVYGLIHCPFTVNDGDAVGAVGAENLQISFVTWNSHVLVSATVAADVQFTVNRLYLEGRRPAIHMLGANEDLNSFEGADEKTITIEQGYYSVTGAFIADENIDVTDGTGATAGTCAFDGDTVALGTTESMFNNDNMLRIFRGGLKQRKGVDVNWVDDTHLSFTDPLEIGEDITIQRYIFQVI